MSTIFYAKANGKVGQKKKKKRMYLAIYIYFYHNNNFKALIINSDNINI